MKSGVMILSFIIILALAAPAEAYSFQDALEDFTGFFDNLITGLIIISESDCGNGVIEGSEICDKGDTNGKECKPEYGSKCDYCSTNCKIIKLDGAYCGDNNCNKDYEDEITCPEDCKNGGNNNGGGTPSQENYRCKIDSCLSSDDILNCIYNNCIGTYPEEGRECYSQCQAEYTNLIVIPYCGDSLCNGEETCNSCEDCWNEQADCENNQICSLGECIIEGEIPESCGNGQLEVGEDCEFDSDCGLNQTCSYQCECISFEPILVDCDDNTFSNLDCINNDYDGCVEGNNTWFGDGYCDGGTDGLNLNCEKWDYDNGDCTSDILDCNGNIVSTYQYENWLGDGECDSGQYGVNFNCTENEFDNGDCLSHEGDCLEGEFADCNNICYNLNTIDNNLGNNICDVDSQGSRDSLVLNCGEWNYDNGDCDCVTDSDCSIILSNEEICNEGNCEYTDCNNIIIRNNECIGNIFPNSPPDLGVNNGISGYVIMNKPVKSKKTRGIGKFFSGDGVFYEGCIFGERTLLNDGICTNRLNCELWGFDNGECNSNITGNNFIMNPEEISLEFGDYNIDNFDLNMNSEFIMNQIISLAYVEDIENNKIFSYKLKLEQGKEEYFNLLLANPKKHKEDYIIQKETLFSTETGFNNIMNIYEEFNHKIVMIEAKNSVLNIIIHSDPTELQLTFGEEKEVDINKDGLKDISLKYNSLNKDGTVNIIVTYLKLNTEEISEEDFISLNPNIKQEIEELLYSPNNMIKLSGIVTVIVLLFMIILIHPKKKKKR
jgi:hypothetical protein